MRAIESIFRRLIRLGLIDSKDGKCFEVGLKLNYGSLILLLAALTGMISTQVITRLPKLQLKIARIDKGSST